MTHRKSVSWYGMSMMLVGLCFVVPALGLASSWHIEFDPQPAVFKQSDPEKIIYVLLKNISKHETWIWASNPLNDYDLSLTDSKGSVIPMTAKGLYAVQRQRSTFFSTSRVTIAINAVYKNFIMLNEFYKFSPGHYVVHVRLRAMNQDNYDWEARKHLAQPAQDVPTGSTPIEIKP